MRFVLFFALSLLIVGFCGWFTYFSITRAFFNKSFSGKFFVAALVFGIVFSFFVASFLSRFYENSFVRYFYFISAVLLGVWVLAFFALILGWLFFGVFKVAGLFISLRTIVSLALVIAIIYSGYNLWNAFYNIKVSNIDVSIKNLPEYWVGKKIVQISDVHLGNIVQVDFLNKIVDLVNRQNADLIFITGDLFDGMDGDLSRFIEPLLRLKSNLGIFFVSGNHELYLGLDKALDIINKTRIQFIDSKIVHINGLQIIGIGYGQDMVAQDIKKIVTSNPDFISSAPTILLYHIPLPSQIKAAKEIGVNLYLAGHTHVGQILPFKLITHLIYKGYDFGLHKEGDFYQYTSSGVGTWGPPFRSGNNPEIVVISLN
jgi:predicted MPP superfamily phosphohydrolase